MLNLRLVGDNAFNDIDTSLRILLDGMQLSTVPRGMDARSIEWIIVYGDCGSSFSFVLYFLQGKIISE